MSEAAPIIVGAVLGTIIGLAILYLIVIPLLERFLDD